MAAEGAAAPAAPRHRAGDLVMVAPEEGGDEPPCPARVTAVAAGGDAYDVTYCGWSRLWDAEGIGAARIEPPSADCAKLMAEIDALEGLFQIPRTRAVTHVGDAPEQVAMVIDRAVRQPARGEPMVVMFYLDHVLKPAARKDDWYRASELQASSRLAAGCCLAIDLEERGMEEHSTLRLRLHGEDLWIEANDYIRFVSRGQLTRINSVRWPPSLKGSGGQGVMRKQKFIGSVATMAFPASVLASVLKAMPDEHAREHRKRGDDSWLRSEIAAELSAINRAAVLTPRTITLPARTITLQRRQFSVNPKVQVRQGEQPLILAVDFCGLVAGKRRKPQPVDAWCARHLSDVETGRFDDKLALPSDVLELALDRLAATNPSEIASAAEAELFRTSAVWSWLCQELEEVTDAGATRTVLPASRAAAADGLPAAAHGASGFAPVLWETVEQERDLPRLAEARWTESALPVAAKLKKKYSTKTTDKYVWATGEEQCKMTPKPSSQPVRSLANYDCGQMLRME